MPSAKKQRLNNNAAFVTRGPASVTPTPSFVEDQRALLDHANASAHAVNESMTAANAHDANGITQLLINRAYRHAVMDNSELHGTNPGTMLVTWGSDDSSQLGQVAYLDLPEKEKKTEYPPVPLNFNKKIRAVTCHGLGSAALSVSGQVYSWGVNDEGNCNSLFCMHQRYCGK
jgi:alpha-tubulin suppressor-like RCC1 family protein